MGELDGRPGAGFHLVFHGSLILAKDFQAAARRQLAGIEIQQEVDFPVCKTIAIRLSAQEFTDQASEAIELELAVLVVICRSHIELIGGMGTEH